MPVLKTTLPNDLADLVHEVAEETAQTPAAVIRLAVCQYFGVRPIKPGSVRWRNTNPVIRVIVGEEGENEQE